MDKKEVVEVLQTILDGLTAGESTEKKLEEIKNFYETELAKVNKENQLYQNIIRINIFTDYVSLKQAFEIPNGLRLFQHQLEATTHYTVSSPEFDREDFDKFVEDYLAAARNDSRHL